MRLWARNRQSNSCESQHSGAKERRSPGATHRKGELSLGTAMPQVMEKSERRVRGGPEQCLWRAPPHLGATSKQHNHPALVSSGSHQDVKGQLQELQDLAGTGQSSTAKESKARPFLEGRKTCGVLTFIGQLLPLQLVQRGRGVAPAVVQGEDEGHVIVHAHGHAGPREAPAARSPPPTGPDNAVCRAWCKRAGSAACPAKPSIGSVLRVCGHGERLAHPFVPLAYKYRCKALGSGVLRVPKITQGVYIDPTGPGARGMAPGNRGRLRGAGMVLGAPRAHGSASTPPVEGQKAPRGGKNPSGRGKIPF